MQMSTQILKNAKIVTPEAVVDGEVVIEDGKVSLKKAAKGGSASDLSGKYVVPGFIDIHFHGYNLFEFTAGKYDPAKKAFDNSPQAYSKGLESLCGELAGFGVTGLYLGTWAAPIEQLKYAFGQMRQYCGKQEAGCRILGGLVEGTFINPNMAGAQNPKFVFEQDRTVFDAIEADDLIKMVNVAPDFNEKSCGLTEYLANKGIIVGAGHSMATGNQIRSAIKAGLKYWVHFLNGPTGHNFKPFDGGGAVEAVLQDSGMFVEQIVDGYHINPCYVLDVIKRKGADRTLAVTDALYAAGSNISQFELGGIKGEVFNNEYIRVVGKPNTLEHADHEPGICKSAQLADVRDGGHLE
jgi:N-acetylglucosamine-6-phosphate deacetylase